MLFEASPLCFFKGAPYRFLFKIQDTCKVFRYFPYMLLPSVAFNKTRPTYVYGVYFVKVKRDLIYLLPAFSMPENNPKATLDYTSFFFA